MADTPPVPKISEFAYEWTGLEVERFNDPQLNSPQPCQHGAGCTYYGSCRFVHPGEEGTGRMVFEERVVTRDDGSSFMQPACVRLIGNAGFYRRRRAEMSWPEFCARNGIPYSPNPSRLRDDIREDAEDGNVVVGDAPVGDEAPTRPSSRGGGRQHNRVHSSYRPRVVPMEQGGRGRGRGGGRGRGRGGGGHHRNDTWVGLPQTLERNP